jgi:hypothetical protein
MTEKEEETLKRVPTVKADELKEEAELAPKSVQKRLTLKRLPSSIDWRGTLKLGTGQPAPSEPPNFGRTKSWKDKVREKTKTVNTLVRKATGKLAPVPPSLQQPEDNDGRLQAAAAAREDAASMSPRERLVELNLLIGNGLLKLADDTSRVLKLEGVLNHLHPRQKSPRSFYFHLLSDILLCSEVKSDGFRVVRIIPLMDSSCTIDDGEDSDSDGDSEDTDDEAPQPDQNVAAPANCGFVLVTTNRSYHVLSFFFVPYPFLL